ncbi:MAG TPA: cation diffusion facilitator family transporter [Planctomycetota bacterium]|jgi:cobalt-zinc-cadmium efflux system protein
MGQQHHHPRPPEAPEAAPGMRRGERRRLLLVLLLTGATMVAEIIGGLLSGSMSLLGDAFHMLTHFGAILLSYAAILVAVRPAGPEKTFRNWRLEVLASFLNGLLLIPIAGYIIWESVDRWLHPVQVKLPLMLAVGAVGLLVNLLSAAFLHHHSKHDLNIRGAFLHMLADSLSSVGVIAAGVLIAVLGDRVLWADPAAAVLISVMILAWSLGLVRQSVRILLEAVPAHVDLEKVRAALREDEEVADIHDLHIWTITSRMYALTAHVCLKRDLEVSKTEELCHRLQHLLDDRFEINHATLQFEVRPAEKLHCEHEHEPAGEIGHVHPH